MLQRSCASHRYVGKRLCPVPALLGGNLRTPSLNRFADDVLRNIHLNDNFGTGIVVPNSFRPIDRSARLPNTFHLLTVSHCLRRHGVGVGIPAAGGVNAGVKLKQRLRQSGLRDMFVSRPKPFLQALAAHCLTL